MPVVYTSTLVLSLLVMVCVALWAALTTTYPTTRGRMLQRKKRKLTPKDRELIAISNQIEKSAQNDNGRSTRWLRRRARQLVHEGAQLA